MARTSTVDPLVKLKAEATAAHDAAVLWRDLGNEVAVEIAEARMNTALDQMLALGVGR